MCLCVWCIFAIVCAWRSKNNFQELVLFLNHTGPRNQTRVVSHVSGLGFALLHKYSYQSHLLFSPNYKTKTTALVVFERWCHWRSTARSGLGSFPAVSLRAWPFSEQPGSLKHLLWLFIWELPPKYSPEAQGLLANWPALGAGKESPGNPLLGSAGAGLISRGQRHYHANPGPPVPLPWYGYVPVFSRPSWWAQASLCQKLQFSLQRMIFLVLTSLKCKSWFEKILTSTICYFSLNNLHFKVNMAFISEWASVCCLNWSQMSMKKMLLFYWRRMFSSPKWHQRQTSSFKL